MKTMNYFFLLSLLIVGQSCSEPELNNVELLATDLSYSKTYQSEYLNGLELYINAAINTQLKLKKQIAQLKEAIDGGQKDLTPKLEVAQKNEANVLEYLNNLREYRAPKGGKFPPRPPRGCFIEPETGCIPEINLSIFRGIQITKNLEEPEVVIRDTKNRVVGKGDKISLTKEGLKVVTLDADFKGDATLFISVKTELSRNDMVLEIPVVRN